MAKNNSRKKSKTKTKAKAKTRNKSATAKTKRQAKPKTAKRKTSAAKVGKSGAPAAVSLQQLPDLEVQTTNGGRMQLASLKGKNVVIYFYPKDDTPGCTTEGCDIRDHYSEFQQLDAVVLGVSRDDLNSHERFKAKFNFPFELVSDPDEKLCRAFGVMKEKSNYGRTYIGVDRSTFIFDKGGKLRKEFRGVSVPGHIDQILEEIRRL
jgi:thioredoxin-dependent peroxiredoxin